MADTLEDGARMFAQIGKITSTWEVCELYLADIYQTLAESENAAPYKGYGALTSSQARFELLEIALNQYFRRNTHLKLEIGAAIVRAKELAALRNKVAHAAVIPIFRGSQIKLRTMPMSYQTRRYKRGGPSYFFTPDELDQADVEVTVFAMYIGRLRDRLFSFDDKRRARRVRRSRAPSRKEQSRAR